MHDRNYYDGELYRLELFEHLAQREKNLAEQKKYRTFQKILFTMQRSKWKGTIKKNNGYCDAILLSIYKPAFKLIKEIVRKTNS